MGTVGFSVVIVTIKIGRIVCIHRQGQLPHKDVLNTDSQPTVITARWKQGIAQLQP